MVSKWYFVLYILKLFFLNSHYWSCYVIQTVNKSCISMVHELNRYITHVLMYISYSCTGMSCACAAMSKMYWYVTNMLAGHMYISYLYMYVLYLYFMYMCKYLYLYDIYMCKYVMNVQECHISRHDWTESIKYGLQHLAISVCVCVCVCGYNHIIIIWNLK